MTELFLTRFYERDVRQAVRIRMLAILKETVITNIILYEDKLMEVAVLPYLASLDAEIDK